MLLSKMEDTLWERRGRRERMRAGDGGYLVGEEREEGGESG
jgi:hypothetical protein